MAKLVRTVGALVTSTFKNAVSYSPLAFCCWLKAKGQKLRAKLGETLATVVTKVTQ